MNREQLKNDVLYVCTLIEYIGRKMKLSRSEIAEVIGIKEIRRQLELAEVNHSLSLEEVSDELIEAFSIESGDYDTVGECLYDIPSETAIAKDYQRIIMSVSEEDMAQTIFEVFTSFISDEISDFNSSVYYSSPDYLKQSYLEGKLLA